MANHKKKTIRLKRNQVGVRLTDYDFNFLQKIADKEGVSLAEIIRRIIKNHEEANV